MNSGDTPRLLSAIVCNVQRYCEIVQLISVSHTADSQWVSDTASYWKSARFIGFLQTNTGRHAHVQARPRAGTPTCRHAHVQARTRADKPTSKQTGKQNLQVSKQADRHDEKQTSKKQGNIKDILPFVMLFAPVAVAVTELSPLCSRVLSLSPENVVNNHKINILPTNVGCLQKLSLSTGGFCAWIKQRCRQTILLKWKLEELTSFKLLFYHIHTHQHHHNHQPTQSPWC